MIGRRCLQQWRCSRSSYKPISESVFAASRRSWIHKTHIDNIIQPLQEDQQHSSTNESSRDDLRDPNDVGVASPREPKHTDGQQSTTDNHRDHPLLGHNIAGLFHLSSESGLGEVSDEAGSKSDSDNDGCEWESTDASVPAAFLLEGDGVGFEAEVEEAVDEAHIQSDLEESN